MYGYEPVLHLIRNPRLQVVEIDVRNLEAKHVANFDVVYHLAGISGMPACAANPSAAEAINVQASRHLCELLHKDQVLIYASTTSFYGASGAACDESVPVQPVSIYGRTKYEAERITQQRENSISLRFATIFGTSPKMRVDLLVNDFAYHALKERSLVIFAGHSKRTFIHIDDAIEAYLFALDHLDAMRGAIFNVGTEALNLSKNEIAAAISRHISYEVITSSLPDLDVRHFLVSFQRLRGIGFGTRLTLDDGLRDLLKLYAFYNSNRKAALI
jgi:nucleoside-diphosphate-sugar epimerase